MQLILPQLELEQAIRNYVNELINVREGTELHIDLKAGRGVDGFTATVDIIKAGTPVPVKTVVPDVQMTPAKAFAKAQLNLPIPEPEVTEPKKQAEKLADVQPTKVTEKEPEQAAPTEETPVKSEQQDAATKEQEKEVSTPVAPTGRKPLFANLKKPE